jgi:hypothetical protein
VPSIEAMRTANAARPKPRWRSNAEEGETIHPTG